MQKEKYTATLKTNKGTMVVELDSTIAPTAVASFINLTSKGFYDGIKFHRVIPGFMIQGGDPLTKDASKKDSWGTGGPDYRFADEIVGADGKVKSVYQNGYKRGVLAMANSGPNTNGSQFFIMHADYPLPPSYTIFGKIVKGIETVDSIASSKTDRSDRPLEDVVIESVTVE